MGRHRCRVHGHPSKVNCPDCHIDPRSPKELLAYRLMIFLGVNEVESYVSEHGYQLKKITVRPWAKKPWDLPVSPEEAP